MPKTRKLQFALTSILSLVVLSFASVNWLVSRDESTKWLVSGIEALFLLILVIGCLALDDRIWSRALLVVCSCSIALLMWAALQGEGFTDRNELVVGFLVAFLMLWGLEESARNGANAGKLLDTD